VLRHAESGAPSSRPLRVGEEIRHVLADALARGDLRDPALAGRSLTVTEVRMSPDLKRGTVYVLPFGSGDTAAALAGLERASPYLRREVARRVRLRVVPVLEFEADATFDQAARIDRLLRDVRTEPGDDGSEDEPQA